MARIRGDNHAFGWPGLEPRWTHGDKDGIGTGYWRTETSCVQQASRRTFASFSPRILRRGFRREAISQKVNYFGHWNGGQACPGL
jgi:hypothetical protein